MPLSDKVKVSIDLNQVLTAALMLIAEYRKGRDHVQAAGTPTDATGALLSDADLIALMKLDAAALVARVDERIRAYGGTPPVDPPVGD